MGALFLDSPFFTAVVGAAGLIVGALIPASVQRLRDRATVEVDAAKVATDSAITSLTLLMEAQAKRIDALEKDFAALEEKHAGEQAEHAITAKKKRILEEKYSAACEWILVVQTAWEGLKIRLAAIEFEHREIPPLPTIVALDLEPSEVAAKHDWS